MQRTVLCRSRRELSNERRSPVKFARSLCTDYSYRSPRFGIQQRERAKRRVVVDANERRGSTTDERRGSMTLDQRLRSEIAVREATVRSELKNIVEID